MDIRKDRQMDNEKSDLYYKDLLEKTETMLEKHLVDVLENSLDKNVKAEQYITALTNARFYLKDKLKPYYFKTLCDLSQEIVDEVNNEVTHEG